MYLDRNSHSVYNLNYHLVLVVKYRRKVINDEISNRLKDIFDYVGKHIVFLMMRLSTYFYYQII